MVVVEVVALLRRDPGAVVDGALASLAVCSVVSLVHVRGAYWCDRLSIALLCNIFRSSAWSSVR